MASSLVPVRAGNLQRKPKKRVTIRRHWEAGTAAWGVGVVVGGGWYGISHSQKVLNGGRGCRLGWGTASKDEAVLCVFPKWFQV